jgi:hypothetical protein
MAKHEQHLRLIAPRNFGRVEEDISRYPSMPCQSRVTARTHLRHYVVTRMSAAAALRHRLQLEQRSSAPCMHSLFPLIERDTRDSLTAFFLAQQDPRQQNGQIQAPLAPIHPVNASKAPCPWMLRMRRAFLHQMLV